MPPRKKRYIAAGAAGEVVGIVGRVLRSAMFNFLMFCLGFAACYVWVVRSINEAADEGEAAHCRAERRA